MKHHAGMKLCMRGRKRCEGRIDKLSSVIVLVGVWLIGEQTEGIKVIVTDKSIRKKMCRGVEW
jgi:hypothetical protein